MKKTTIQINLYLLIILVGILSLATNATSAYATVGGPTFIGDFTYNKADESVYYVENSQSGRGCPPILKKISLNTSSISTVYSCDEVEKLVASNGTINKIGTITQNFKPLQQINIAKNNIVIDVNFAREEKIAQTNEVIKRHFIANVYQNSNKISEFTLTGCSLDQPFTFAAFAIPGFDKKIILLLSTKGDCWEGGYTMETPYVVAGIENLDKTSDIKSTKSDQAALTSSLSTITLSEKDQVEIPQPQQPVQQPQPVESPALVNTTYDASNKEIVPAGKTNNANNILIAVVALIAGLTIGTVLKRK